MKTLLVVVALSLGLASNAFATDDFKRAFNNLDTNRDGKIDMKELDAAAFEIFKKYDKNGDGFLDKSEFSAIKDAKSRFEDLDKNKDGKLDMKELRDAAQKKFDLYDKNHDGFLDPAECNPRGLDNVNPLFLIYF